MTAAVVTGADTRNRDSRVRGNDAGG